MKTPAQTFAYFVLLYQYKSIKQRLYKIQLCKLRMQSSKYTSWFYASLHPTLTEKGLKVNIIPGYTENKMRYAVLSVGCLHLTQAY